MKFIVILTLIACVALVFEYKYLNDEFKPISLCTMITLVSAGLLLCTRVASVSGDSMLGTYKSGEFVVVSDLNNSNLQRGDIIVFYSNKLDSCLIKRVIGLSGDVVEIADNKVYINGDEITEDYIYEPMVTEDELVNVSDGKLFVMGDNRNKSLDSRSEKLGLIDKNTIIGSVVLNLGPFNSAMKKISILIIFMMCVVFYASRSVLTKLNKGCELNYEM